MYGVLTDIAIRKLGTKTRITTKRSSAAYPSPPNLGIDDPPVEQLEIQPKRKTTTLSFYLKDLPKKLVNIADKVERRRLLAAMHERFWHAPPADMMRLLEAAVVPRSIVLEGIDVATTCAECVCVCVCVACVVCFVCLVCFV